MEINNTNTKKVIAFYLPQYHTIPENDKWWGKGFTEWTNTRKAVPLFEGHYQPNTPLNDNYYDLSDVRVMENQARLAKQYGVFGFCYYHYWFKDGKKLLEKPVEQMLDNPKVDIPFCLCWANENWSRNWDGGNREILMPQKYGGISDWEKHFSYLLRFFKDERYLKYDNAPIFLIYRPEEIEELNAMVAVFKKLAVESGFRDLIVISQFPTVIIDPYYKNLNLDYKIKFQPVTAEYIEYMLMHHQSFLKKSAIMLARKVKIYNGLKRLKKKIIVDDYLKELKLRDYDRTWNAILNNDYYSSEYISCGFTSWDNSPRTKTGTVYVGSTPEKFEHYMKELFKKPSALNLFFLNAWNEWAEGAYLEPDNRYGYAYLESLKRALE